MELRFSKGYFHSIDGEKRPSGSGGSRNGVVKNNRVTVWLIHGRKLENKGCGNNRKSSWRVSGGFDLFPTWRVIYPVDSWGGIHPPDCNCGAGWNRIECRDEKDRRSIAWGVGGGIDGDGRRGVCD